MNESPKPAPVCSKCGSSLAADAPEGLCPRCLVGLGLQTETEVHPETGPHGTRVSPTPPVRPEELAKFFPNLEILECLGRGGMGAVYKARQLRLNRLVALKIIAPEKEKDPHFAERFQREAQALAQLAHPNIVTVHDFGEAGGLFYLLMEYVDGLNLRQLLESRKIAPEEALGIVPAICDALQYAHQQSIVHRDIKPENILLDKQGRVKIADFGVAKILGTDAKAEPLTQEKQVMGTPHYMAPEQIEKPTKVDHRADIYSLGVVFYEMLTGELPLGRFAPPSQKVQVDVRLDEVVLRALEKEPERRYQQASEVKTHVETISKSPAAEPRGRVQEPRAPKLSRTALAGAVWAPFFFIGFVPLYWGLKPVVHFGPPLSGPAWWQMVAFAIGALAVAAPFATTVLGVIATIQIRNSWGTIYGMGLAIADALFYPLLLLDAIVFYAILRIFEFYPHPYEFQQHPGFAFVWLGGLVVILVLDYFIIRAVWRFAAPRPGHGDLPRARVPAFLIWAILIVVSVPCLLGFVLWMSYETLGRPRPTLQEQFNFPTPVTNLTVAASTPFAEVQRRLQQTNNPPSRSPDYVKAMVALQHILQRPGNEWERAFERGDLDTARKEFSQLVGEFEKYNRLVQGGPVPLTLTKMEPMIPQIEQALQAGDKKTIEDLLNSTNANSGHSDTSIWDTLQTLALQQRLERQTNPVALAAYANSGLVFGPVMDRVVSDLDTGTEETCFLDLDTGNFCDSIFPVGVKSSSSGQRAIPWIQPVISGYGVDVQGDAKEHALQVFDIIAIPAENWLFEALTSSAVVTNTELNLEANRSTRKLVAKKTPTTWLIHTREGGSGMLQIVGFKENPKAVRIRYKLINPLR